MFLCVALVHNLRYHFHLIKLFIGLEYTLRAVRVPPPLDISHKNPGEKEPECSRMGCREVKRRPLTLLWPGGAQSARGKLKMLYLPENT